MGSFFGGGKPKVDTSLEDARRKAEADAKAEQERLQKLRDEETDAIKRGLRGTRSLFSAAGERGFDPLGG